MPIGYESKTLNCKKTNENKKKKIEWHIPVISLVGVPVGDTVSGTVTVGVRVTEKKNREGQCKKGGKRRQWSEYQNRQEEGQREQEM